MEEKNQPTIYNPEFIPFYPEIQKKYNLNNKETLLYGFIRFYISTLPDKEFYFSNESLSKIFNISTTQISIHINNLAKKCPEIEITYKIKANGGKIRFIKFRNKENLKSDFKKTLSLTLRKLKENNNKINNNMNLLLNNKLVITEKKFGNQLVNFVLDEFKRKKGFYPTDKKPRQRAWNLIQRINTFIKNNPNLPAQINSPENIISRYFNYLAKKDYFSKIENLETVVRKIEIYFGFIEKILKQKQVINKITENENQPINQEVRKKYEEARKKLLEKFKL